MRSSPMAGKDDSALSACSTLLRRKLAVSHAFQLAAGICICCHARQLCMHVLHMAFDAHQEVLVAQGSEA